MLCRAVGICGQRCSRVRLCFGIGRRGCGSLGTYMRCKVGGLTSIVHRLNKSFSVGDTVIGSVGPLREWSQVLSHRFCTDSHSNSGVSFLEALAMSESVRLRHDNASTALWSSSLDCGANTGGRVRSSKVAVSHSSGPESFASISSGAFISSLS